MKSTLALTLLATTTVFVSAHNGKLMRQFYAHITNPRIP